MVEDLQGHICDSPVTVIVHDASTTTEFESAVEGGMDVDEAAQEFLSDAQRDPVAIPVFKDGAILHERKEGPASISRRAEIDFPIEGVGDDWFYYVNGYRETGVMQKCSIMMTPQNYPELRQFIPPDQRDIVDTRLVGYIGSVGANGANTGHLTVFGPYKLLEAIPVDVTFHIADEPFNTLRGIINWYVGRFVEGQPMFDSQDVELNILGLDQDETFHLGGYFHKNSFSASRDTLADVTKWIRESFGFDVQFESIGPGRLGIIVEAAGTGLLEEEIERAEGTGSTHDPNVDFGIIDSVLAAQQSQASTYDATHDGFIEVVNNSALYEMKPYNGVKLIGKDNGDTYPEAVAVYPPLVERAGGQILSTAESDKSSPAALEREAHTRLKESLDTVSGGTMDILLYPEISPRDKILAQPACAGHVNASMPDLTYEVQRTAHKIEPNAEGSPVNTSELAVSMSIDPERIDTTSTRKDVQPAQEAANQPDGSAPWEDGNIDWSTVT